MSRKRVILSSPYSSSNDEHLARNIEYARRAVRDSLLADEAPLPAHLIYTQGGIMDENKALQRKMGEECEKAWSRECDQVVLYIDYGISNGMQICENRAKLMGLDVQRRKIGQNP